VRRGKKPAAPTLGLTAANIAISLVINGVEPDFARAAGLEFQRIYGAAKLGDPALELEILEWAKEARALGIARAERYAT
jgi:hypothetical protein